MHPRISLKETTNALGTVTTFQSSIIHRILFSYMIFQISLG